MAIPKSQNNSTKQGVHGYSIPPVDAFTGKNPNADLEACAYKSLICDRATTLDAAIDDSPVVLECTIEPIHTYKTLICDRSITIDTPIDTTPMVIDTEIGCP